MSFEHFGNEYILHVDYTYDLKYRRVIYICVREDKLI
jgi:hypothetical protein